MRWIYLSPHFDDAVLSCGGLIFDQTCGGTAVEIWTVFAGTHRRVRFRSSPRLTTNYGA